MRFGRDALIFKALCAIDEAVEQAESQVVRPTFALRFALAYLYSVGGGERWIYDGFWRNIQAVDPLVGQPPMRATNARSGLQGIMRSAGVNPTFEATQALRAARRARTEEAHGRSRSAKAISDERTMLREEAEERRRRSNYDPGE